MQRVTSMLPSWDKTKTGSKKGFDSAWKALDKLGAPINKLSNKIGSEAFWPTTLDKESDKAARILKSFCKDGFYADEERPLNQEGARGKQKVLKKIPQKVIKDAVGLAIFTTMRSGLWVSGAGGSGVLVARKEDGTWSPPSGILLHTSGLGFLIGVDIYDCVVVINNRKALDAFKKIRATIGGEISAVAGPAGVGGMLENDGKWKQANRPVFTYLKSRGFYAGVQIEGTIVIERTDENERFYGERIGVGDILAGKARHPPYEIKLLMETLKAAEGRLDVDEATILELAKEPAPGDFELKSPTTEAPTFGIPEADDPDPFGVLALEKEGFEIREAGTKERPQSTQFEYNPSPTSPVYNKFYRQSMDTVGSRSNRASYMSTRSYRARTSMDRATQTSEMGTQTDDSLSQITSPAHSDDQKRLSEIEAPVDVDAKEVEAKEVDYTQVDLEPLKNINHTNGTDVPLTTEGPRGHDDAAKHKPDSSYGTDDEDEEEPVVFDAAPAQATVLRPKAINARGGLVDIPKRPPPPLPPRSSARSSQLLMVDQGSGQTPNTDFSEVDLHTVGTPAEDQGSGQTPMKPDFSEVDFHTVSTPAEDQMRSFIMQDLDKANPTRNSLETVVAKELQEQNLENIEGSDLGSQNNKNLQVPVLETPSSDMKDTFWTASHKSSDTSIPVTPGGFPEEK